MRQGGTLVVLGVLLGLCLFWVVGEALAAEPAKSAKPALQEQASGLGLYKPPVLGAPRLRIGGGVRGMGGDGDVPVVQVLAPRQAGQTTLAQPTLYWHLDRATPYAVEITIMAERGVSPLARQILPGPVAGGLHAFRLQEQGKRLELGVDYTWFVAVIVQPQQRSRDALACGGLRLVDPPAGLAESVRSSVKGTGLGAVYAKAGLWYEAINALVEVPHEGPGQLGSAAQLAAFLQQEEITGVTFVLSPQSGGASHQ